MQYKKNLIGIVGHILTTSSWATTATHKARSLMNFSAWRIEND
jgi:hypothetical protein